MKKSNIITHLDSLFSQPNNSILQNASPFFTPHTTIYPTQAHSYKTQNLLPSIREVVSGSYNDHISYNQLPKIWTDKQPIPVTIQEKPIETVQNQIHCTHQLHFNQNQSVVSNQSYSTHSQFDQIVSTSAPHYPIHPILTPSMLEPKKRVPLIHLLREILSAEPDRYFSAHELCEILESRV